MRPDNHLPHRAISLAVSPTLAMAAKARSLKARGVDVVDLSGGDPGFATPAHIRRAALAAMEAGDTHYVESAGVPALREAIADKLTRENGVPIAPEGVLVTPGGKAALFVSAMALFEPGMEVLVLEPAWVSFAPIVELAGAVAVPVALSADDGYTLRQEALRAAATPRTRGLIVNSPNNPTGRVLSVSEVEAVRAVATELNLIVFSDEIYEKILYDGQRHISIGSLEGMAERTLTFNGFSKSYAMTGWRLGYVAGPVELIAAAAKVSGHAFTCVTSFAQAGAVAALLGPQDELASMLEVWAQRRQLVVAALGGIPGVRCAPPEGAFYGWVDVRALGLRSTVLADHLLDEARVALTPGAAFGAAGEGHLRFSFAAADDELQRGLVRMAELFTGLRVPL